MTKTMNHFMKVVATTIVLTCSNAEAVTILFKNHVTTNARTLGDIVTIKGDESTICPLQDLKLDGLPKAGEVISQKAINQWLALKQHCKKATIKWQGKHSIIIKPAK